MMYTIKGFKILVHIIIRFSLTSGDNMWIEVMIRCSYFGN